MTFHFGQYIIGMLVGAALALAPLIVEIFMSRNR